MLLAALLLLGQSALLLHQVDFVAHADGHSCTLCLAAHGMDHPVPAMASLPNATPIHHAVSFHPLSVVAGIHRHRPTARAPPVLLRTG